MFGVMNHLNIVVCKDAEEATEKGFHYRDPVKAVEIEKVVVVQQGTVGGNSTVDIILRDKDGNQFVTMVTGNLLKSIPC